MGVSQKFLYSLKRYKMFTYVVDYNNGNLLIIKTEAILQDFNSLIDEAKKDETSPYEKLLNLLEFHKLKYEIVIDTYDLPTYEI